MLRQARAIEPIEPVHEASRNGRRRPARAVDLAVVVPTRNEAGNVETLVRRLEAVLGSDRSEVLFVDDSTDDTPTEIERVAAASRLQVRLIHRVHGERTGGLGGAVAAGLAATDATWVCVMDGDLQHPPELVPELRAKADDDDLELVVASRYARTGSTGEFAAARRAISGALTAMARVAFPLRLRRIRDPLSGFFLVRRESVDVRALKPRGFKILLEIVARSGRMRAGEVPFRFGERHAGESKASLGEGLTYVIQLARLRAGPTLGGLTRFGLVGASGLVVNTLLFALLVSGGMHYVLAAVLSTQGSTLSNLILTERWVFGDREHRFPKSIRAALFFGMNNIALAARVPLLVLLVASLGLAEVLANVVSLAAVMLVRYAVADRWIWRTGRAEARKLHSYAIHGIASVASEVALPELEAFRVPELSEHPTIRVRIARLTRAQSDLVTALAFMSRHTRYDEGMGRLGFGIDISVGRCTEVVACPLLRHSPHVLYTNVVEPILRWTFVREGYALVHAACIASNGDGYLITARTDTGKTTTILKTLDATPWSFLSDDLTLLAPDGRILSYPKPLTISRHTVAAVRSPLLTRRERLGLFLQSRVHSRGGRQFAIAMLKAGLPVATINALVQLVIPPPKFHIERLVPGVHKAREARLAGMVVIERGGTGERRLSPEEAVETLLANCEDAFGFAPYPSIAPFLQTRRGHRLVEDEQAIVSSALAAVETVVLASETMDWSERLPTVTHWNHEPREPRARALLQPVGIAAANE